MLSHEYQDLAVSMPNRLPLPFEPKGLSGFWNMTDSGNQRQTCWFLLHRRRKHGKKTSLGRDYERAELCPCGGDSRLYGVIATNTWRGVSNPLWAVRLY